MGPPPAHSVSAVSGFWARYSIRAALSKRNAPAVGDRVAVRSTSARVAPLGSSSFALAVMGTLRGMGDLAGMGMIKDWMMLRGEMGQGGKGIVTGVLMTGILKEQLAPQARQVTSRGSMASTVALRTIFVPAVIAIVCRSMYEDTLVPQRRSSLLQPCASVFSQEAPVVVKLKVMDGERELIVRSTLMSPAARVAKQRAAKARIVELRRDGGWEGRERS